MTTAVIGDNSSGSNIINKHKLNTAKPLPNVRREKQLNIGHRAE